MKKFTTVLATAALTMSLGTATFAQTYTVKKGDTVSAIAKANGMTVQEFKKMNKNVKNINKLKKGQKVQVKDKPKPKPIVKPVSKTVSSSKTITPAKPVVVATPVQPKPSAPETAPAPNYNQYTVVQGDTGTKIAQNYAMTLTQLTQINPTINWNNLQIGTILNVIGNPVQTNNVSSTTSTPPTTSAPALASGQMYYKILAGDTEQSIATKYNMTLSALEAMNPQVTTWNTLSANQQIIVATPSVSTADIIVNSTITSAMKANFLAQVAPAAIQAWQQYNILPSLTIAQSILESYWGQSWLAINGQNYFGIKPGSSWTGATITMATKEYDANNNMYVVNAEFRKYTSLMDSINDHTQLLLKPRYANLVGCTDYMAATVNIQQDGYATDPNYSTLLQNVIQANNLVQYDIQAGAVQSVTTQSGN